MTAQVILSLKCPKCDWLLATPQGVPGLAYCANKNCELYHKQFDYELVGFPLKERVHLYPEDQL